MTSVHSALPARLADEVDAILVAAGIAHRRHDGEDAVESAVAAAADPDALALVGPYRSRDVAEAVEATAPAELALVAPVATWAGVTRDDEPGCDDDPADHRGTVFRLVARDTVVAARIADDLRRANRHAVVIAGDHEYGEQLDAQLALARLARVSRADEADVVVLCGLAGEPEIERARSLAPLPLVAFDGVQGADLGRREALLALPFAPDDRFTNDDLFAGVGQARRAAELVIAASAAGARDRRSFLHELRALGGFDEHGDPPQSPVWLWRVGDGWTLTPERQLDALD